jgi:hypothetical protein
MVPLNPTYLLVYSLPTYVDDILFNLVLATSNGAVTVAQINPLTRPEKNSLLELILRFELILKLDIILLYLTI